jgi:RNA polymerase sigma-32 factor
MVYGTPYPIPSQLGRYIQEVEKYPPLTPEEERTLLLRYHDKGDLESARKLVLSNLRYAFRMAWEYRAFAPLMDLIQEANLGLMEAVKKFDPRKPYRFLTYAMYWIRHRLQEYIQSTGSVVRRGTTREERKVQRALPRLKREWKESPDTLTPETIAEKLGVDEKAVYAIVRRQDISLDAPYGEDDTNLYNLLPSERSDPMSTLLEKEKTDLIRKTLEEFIATLDRRDQEILHNRILRDRKLTLAELGKRYGISRERVRQREERIRAKLKEKLQKVLGEEVPLPLPKEVVPPDEGME